MTRQTTLRIAGLLAILFLAWPTSLPAFQAPASDLAESVMRPAAPEFAPVNESIFSAILALASPGPGRAARALAIADRQLDFQRELWLDRDFSPGVRDILEQLPPPGSALSFAQLRYTIATISAGMNCPIARVRFPSQALAIGATICSS